MDVHGIDKPEPNWNQAHIGLDCGHFGGQRAASRPNSLAELLNGAGMAYIYLTGSSRISFNTMGCAFFSNGWALSWTFRCVGWFLGPNIYQCLGLSIVLGSSLYEYIVHRYRFHTSKGGHHGWKINHGTILIFPLAGQQINFVFFFVEVTQPSWSCINLFFTKNQTIRDKRGCDFLELCILWSF